MKMLIEMEMKMEMGTDIGEVRVKHISILIMISRHAKWESKRLRLKLALCFWHSGARTTAPELISRKIFHLTW